MFRWRLAFQFRSRTVTIRGAPRAEPAAASRCPMCGGPTLSAEAAAALLGLPAAALLRAAEAGRFHAQFAPGGRLVCACSLRFHLNPSDS
ncbi:MAG: hypothetical protein R3362_07945 [Rhodothermales bacterium]|nr:hypothetical protein [Rhodothermales bacterium]